MAAKLTVLVTGSSRGIGLAIAKRFIEAGHRVVLHAEKRADLVEAAVAAYREKGYAAASVLGDIACEADCVRMVREAEACFGPVEVLINNAGIALNEKLLTDCSFEELARVTNVDLLGTMLLSKAVIPSMVARKAGSIVNISSYLGLTGCSCEAPYAAAKAGVIGLTKSLAKELAPSGIRVNAVAPGYVPTEMNAEFTPDEVEAIKEDIPLGRLGTAEDIAEAVYFLALDATAGFITGQVLAVDGGSSV